MMIWKFWSALLQVSIMYNSRFEDWVDLLGLEVGWRYG